MNIDLIVVGKTDSDAVSLLVAEYMKRVNHYAKFSMITVPDLRNTRKLSGNTQRAQEGELILKQVSPSDHVVLLDERGECRTSAEFAVWMQKRLNSGVKRVVFVIGGPYGLSDAVYCRADDRLSLSRMTFSHQIVRAIFTEQLYRAFTIIAGEPYHHG